MVQIDQQTPEQHRQRYFELKARARERAEARPHHDVPPAPRELDPERVIHRETIPGGWYWPVRVPRGQALRIINTAGNAGVSAMFWNADDPSERYNAGDTVKLQWTAQLTKGRVLFSDMGRVLASITEDTYGHADTLLGGSSRASNARKYGNPALRNSVENFRLGAGKHGLLVKDVPPCITFFAGVRTEEDGRFVWQDGVARPGDFVDLRAEMNLLVVLSNCPHPLSPETEFAPGPIEAVLWRAPAPAPDDLCRHFGEEAERGFENTDPLFR